MIVNAEKISKGSFFKLLFIGLSLGLFVFFLICGIAAFFGSETVKLENEPIKGIKGLFLAIAIWPVFSLFITCFFWCFGVFGLWLYSFFKPINIRFKGTITVLESDT